MQKKDKKYFSFFIFDVEGLTITGCSRLLGISYAHTQVLIKQLIADGFLIKKVSPDNIREKTVHYTKLGLEMKKVIKK